MEEVSLADKNNSLYGEICDIIFEETLYLRHYIGQVLSNTDELNIGMVQVSVPELGWADQSTAPWCAPRQRHSMTIPEVGEWVEVYFMAGDCNRPVYLEMCNDLKKGDNSFCVPSWYKGNPKLRIIYQSPVSQKGIKLDDTQGILTIDAEKLIELFAGSSEPFVLGTKLNTWISNFITTIFNMHTHVFTGTVSGATCAGTTNPPLPTGTAPTDILSTKIKGQ